MSFDRKHIELVIVLGLITAFAPISIDMYLPALPEIAHKLNSNLDTVQYSLAVFFIGVAIGQLIYGPLTDRFGRRAPLFFGVAIYIAASIGCAMANSITLLITLRFFQALGCCAGIVVPRAAVRDLFERKEAAKVFSSLLLVMGVSPILAPLVGGYINQYFGWRAIFWALVGCGALGSLMAYFKLPETHAPEKRHKNLSLKSSLNTYGELLRDRHFMGYALCGALAQGTMFAYITGSPFVLIKYYHIAPENYGLFFGANAFGLIFTAQMNRLLLKKYELDIVLQKALMIVATMGIVLVAAAIANTSLVYMAGAIFIFISAMGATFPNSSAGALTHQGARAGAASALLGAIQFAIGFCSSSLVSLFDNQTLFPMTGVMCGCALLSISTYFILVKKPQSAA